MSFVISNTKNIKPHAVRKMRPAGRKVPKFVIRKLCSAERTQGCEQNLSGRSFQQDICLYAVSLMENIQRKFKKN